MRTGLLIILLAVGWAGLAGATELPPEGQSQLSTSSSGFVGVTGAIIGYPPAEYRPPAPPPTTACPACAPSGQAQGRQSAQPPQPAQR